MITFLYSQITDGVKSACTSFACTCESQAEDKNELNEYIAVVPPFPFGCGTLLRKQAIYLQTISAPSSTTGW